EDGGVDPAGPVRVEGGYDHAVVRVEEGPELLRRHLDVGVLSRHRQLRRTSSSQATSCGTTSHSTRTPSRMRSTMMAARFNQSSGSSVANFSGASSTLVTPSIPMPRASRTAADASGARVCSGERYRAVPRMMTARKLGSSDSVVTRQAILGSRDRFLCLALVAYMLRYISPSA